MGAYVGWKYVGNAPTPGAFTSLSATGTTTLSGSTVALTGSAVRITGDLTNATVANCALFQTSTTNGASWVQAIPNGTGTSSGLTAYNSATPDTSASYVSIGVTSTTATVTSGKIGAGSYVPLYLQSGASAAIKLETNGTTVNFPVASTRITGDFTSSSQVAFQTSTVNGASYTAIIPNGSSTVSGHYSYNGTDIANAGYVGIESGSTIHTLSAGKTGSGTYLPLAVTINGSERFRFATSGQLGIAGANYGTSGQVLLSGGASAAPSWADTPSIGKQTIWVPAGAMIPRTTNGAASGTTEFTTGADVMIKTLDFDTATEEGAQFWISMPKSWNAGTITAMFYWTAASGSGTVYFGLRAGAVTNDDALDTTDVGTGQTAADTFILANDLHVSPETGAITVGNTPITDDLTLFEVYRDVATDTLGVDAKLLGVKIIYTTSAANDA